MSSPNAPLQEQRTSLRGSGGALRELLRFWLVIAAILGPSAPAGPARAASPADLQGEQEVLLPDSSRVGLVPVTCPCCGHAFEALAAARGNTLGGVDRDLFARSLGPEPVFYLVSACTHCCYAGYLEDFRPGVSLPPDFVAALTEDDSDVAPCAEIEPDTPQRDIPAMVRYELAYACYRRLQRSDEALAWLCLRAAWVARDEFAVLPPTNRVRRMAAYVRRWIPPDSPGANLADRELTMCTTLAAAVAEGHFNEYQRPYAELILALSLRRHGENAPAALLLDRLLDAGALPEELALAARRMRDSIGTERHWQDLAARHLSYALRLRTVPLENEPVAHYLLGELYRRLGDPDQAVELFDRALAGTRLPDELRRWAAEQRSAALSSR